MSFGLRTGIKMPVLTSKRPRSQNPRTRAFCRAYGRMNPAQSLVRAILPAFSFCRPIEVEMAAECPPLFLSLYGSAEAFGRMQQNGRMTPVKAILNG